MVQPATSTPYSALRAVGLLTVSAGALLAGIGALTAWVEVGLKGSSVDVISPVELGVDLPEGTLVLGLAVAAIVVALVARMGIAGARRRAAIVTILAGIGIVVVCAVIVALGTRRFETEAIDRIRSLPEASRPPDGLIDAIADLTEARFRSGLWLSLAGGAVVIAGGVATAAWAGKVGAARAVDRSAS